MRKPFFLHMQADQRLCFRYTDSTIPLLPKPLAILCDCTARFVLDLVGNPEDRFSHNEAQFVHQIEFDNSTSFVFTDRSNVVLLIWCSVFACFGVSFFFKYFLCV